MKIKMNFTMEVRTRAIPKGRPRFRRVGSSSCVYTPKRTRDYEQMIAEEYKSQIGAIFPGPLKVSIDIGSRMPKSIRKREATLRNGLEAVSRIGDVDNLAKSILDALNGVAYQDDSMITELSVKKHCSISYYIVINFQGDYDV